MEKQEISLKWNGYQNNILANLKELFKDENLSDVTLILEGYSFKAHKVVLSANSLLFRSIFQQNPHKDPIIVLHDINLDSLRVLLTFMYYGEVNVTEEFLPILLKTAETLKICGLSTGHDTTRENEVNQTCVPVQPKKRKTTELDDSIKQKKANNKTSNSVSGNGGIPQDLNIVPKEEPIDSPLTDYSGENTNDADVAVLDNSLAKKYPANIDCLSQKVANSDCNLKKWINEVNTTHSCIGHDKGNDEEEKDIEIDKEVETVLQSGTIVESLSITTENLNFVSNEAHTKDKNTTCYASPSFPCPFCPRIYNSWGYRRRHVKSRHFTNRLSCKWCVSVLASTGAWYSHATRAHGVPHEEARNSLVVMVEAHAVLTLKEPSVAQLLGQVGITDNNGKSISEKSN